MLVVEFSSAPVMPESYKIIGETQYLGERCVCVHTHTHIYINPSIWHINHGTKNTLPDMQEFQDAMYPKNIKTFQICTPDDLEINHSKHW